MAAIRGDDLSVSRVSITLCTLKKLDQVIANLAVTFLPLVHLSYDSFHLHLLCLSLKVHRSFTLVPGHRMVKGARSEPPVS